MSARALLDGDGRRQSLDRLDIGLLHLVEKLARVCGERLHVLALSLGKNGVKRQRTLSRARHAGDDHQAVAGEIHRQVLEIVLAGAANANELLGRCHGGTMIGRGGDLALVLGPRTKASARVRAIAEGEADDSRVFLRAVPEQCRNWGRTLLTSNCMSLA